MELTLILAKVMGLVVAAFAVAGLLRPRLISDALHDFDHESFARLAIGCMAIALGVVIVLFHNIWTWDVRGLVTLFGWTALGKGIGYLLFPKRMIHMTKNMVKTEGRTRAFLIACLVLGGYLAYKGFGY